MVQDMSEYLLLPEGQMLVRAGRFYAGMKLYGAYLDRHLIPQAGIDERLQQMASAFDQKRLQAPLIKSGEQLRKYIAAIIGDDVFYSRKRLTL